jgi:hypothetical protein
VPRLVELHSFDGIDEVDPVRGYAELHDRAFGPEIIGAFEAGHSPVPAVRALKREVAFVLSRAKKKSTSPVTRT